MAQAQATPAGQQADPQPTAAIPPSPAPVAAPAPPLSYGAPIGLEAAQSLVDRAVEAGRARGFRLAIAVVEPSGELVAFGRMDDVQYGSINVAQEFWQSGATTAFLASGEKYPDALSGTPAAGVHRAPILLTKAECHPYETVRALTSLSPCRP